MKGSIQLKVNVYHISNFMPVSEYHTAKYTCTKLSRLTPTGCIPTEVIYNVDPQFEI